MKARFRCVMCAGQPSGAVRVFAAGEADDTIPETDRPWLGPPHGSLQIAIDNPAQTALFEAGKSYLVTIEEIPVA